MRRRNESFGGISFRRNEEDHNNSRMHVLQPQQSQLDRNQVLIMIAAALIGGFGLGMAYTMLVFII